MATFSKPITFDKLIQDISSRYHLGPKGRSLVEEALDLIAREPGGIGGFLDRFKAAGLGTEVASWLAGTDSVLLSGQEVEQTLGSDAIGEIADKAGVTQRFARTVLGYAIPKIISMLAQSGFLDAAVAGASARADKIPQHQKEHFLSGTLEDGGATPWFRKLVGPGATPWRGQLVIPGAALLIIVGLLGYFVSTGVAHHGATQPAPVTAQNVPVVIPHAPSKSVPVAAQNAVVVIPHTQLRSAGPTVQPAAVASQQVPSKSALVLAQNALVATSHTPTTPARLALSNRNGLIAYSGTVGDDAIRAEITDLLKTTFGANKISGELTVNEHTDPAVWAEDLEAALDNFKIPGAQALFEGDAVSVGGAISDADLDRIISSLKSIFGPKYAVVMTEGSGATEMAAAPPLLKSDVGENPVTTQDLSALKLPTIYFTINSAAVPSESKHFLQQAAVKMKQLPTATVVRIGGFSDSTGNRAANMKLSQRRANAVRQILVDAGVNPANLIASGYGTAVPITSESETMEGRSVGTMGVRLQEERRVEFRISKQ